MIVGEGHPAKLSSAKEDSEKFHEFRIAKSLLLNLGSLDLTLVIAIPTVLVLVPTILIVGLVVVLHGRKTGWSDLVCHRWRTPDNYDMSGHQPQILGGGKVLVLTFAIMACASGIDVTIFGLALDDA
ncbi:hypothetical protein Tco_0088388 [Tanacetum coccineum]